MGTRTTNKLWRKIRRERQRRRLVERRRQPLRHWPHYNNFLVFTQSIAAKSPRVIAGQIYLCVDKLTQIWFRRWSRNSLPSPAKTAPQYRMGLTVVLSDIATRLQNAEALFPIVTAQNEEGKEAMGWDHFNPTAQQVILAASATSGTSIPTSSPSTIHFFLKARNAK